jgi:hypothetical protein
MAAHAGGFEATSQHFYAGKQVDDRQVDVTHATCQGHYHLE